MHLKNPNNSYVESNNKKVVGKEHLNQTTSEAINKEHSFIQAFEFSFSQNNNKNHGSDSDRMESSFGGISNQTQTPRGRKDKFLQRIKGDSNGGGV